MAQKAVVRLAAVAVLLFVLLLAWQSGYTTAVNENGNTTAINNETITNTAPGAIVVLADSNIDDAVYNDSIIVTDENTTRMTEGDDYEWFGGTGNGTLKVLAGGDLANDSTGNVSYGYGRPTNTQELGNEIAMIPFNAGDAIIPLLGFAFALGGLLILARNR